MNRNVPGINPPLLAFRSHDIRVVNVGLSICVITKSGYTVHQARARKCFQVGRMNPASGIHELAGSHLSLAKLVLRAGL